MTAVGEAQVLLRVELCGRLADTVGEEIDVAVPAEGCDVARLLALVTEHHRELAAQIENGRIKACVNEAIVAGDAQVMPGDTVALFPPVSGG